MKEKQYAVRFGCSHRIVETGSYEETKHWRSNRKVTVRPAEIDAQAHSNTLAEENMRATMNEFEKKAL